MILDFAVKRKSEVKDVFQDKEILTTKAYTNRDIDESPTSIDEEPFNSPLIADYLTTSRKTRSNTEHI